MCCRYRPSLTSIVLGALLGSVPVTAVHALGIRLGNQDGFAVARGNAFAATADNPSAVYYNPAGITQVPGQNVSVGAYTLFYDVDFDAADGGVGTNMVDRVWFLPQLFYTHQIGEGPVTLGLGVYSPFGLGSEWPDDGPFRSHATENVLTYIHFSPVVAYRLSDQLSLAGGLNIAYADADFRRGVFVPDDELRFQGDGTALGANVGILWRPAPEHALGLTYRSPTQVDLEGDLKLSSANEVLLPSFSSAAEVLLQVPQQVVLAYAYRPSADWNLEIDLEWTDWDSVNALEIETPTGTLVDPLEWESSIVLSVGATRYLANGFSISGGYWFAEQTVPTRTFNPRVPDMPFHVFSIGAGYAWQGWRIDGAYQFGYGQRDVSGAPVTLAGESVDGDYEYKSHALQLTLGYAF